MKIIIEFSTDNAAFDDDPCEPTPNPSEIFRVLDQAIEKIKDNLPTFCGALRKPLYDYNGNKIGTVSGSP